MNEEELIEQARLFLEESPYIKLPPLPMRGSTHKDAINLLCVFVSLKVQASILLGHIHSEFYKDIMLENFDDCVALKEFSHFLRSCYTLIVNAYINSSPLGFSKIENREPTEKFKKNGEPTEKFKKIAEEISKILIQKDDAILKAELKRQKIRY